ncbi:MAG: NAD(P)H-dependent oxidoreductase [bacterium]|nr:NAD(P)H-dependent oxidoreductase [bacterium]
MTNIKIITGSTRPGRFNLQPATWIADIAKTMKDTKSELVDLADLNLPMLDEAIPASQNNYQNEHTKNWSKIVADADGFVFVTPEYNHSYSAVLKNALDYLFVEWHYKPVVFLSYGSLAGGTRAVEHLRGVVAELKMYDLRESILLSNYWNDLNDKGEYEFTEILNLRAKEVLSELLFWSKSMKEARGKIVDQSSDFD